MERDNSIAAARDLLIEALGKQSAFWGLGKTTGEIYGVLYVSVVPLTLGEIAKHLKVTKGNISIAVRNLERLGMVRRSWRRGDRKVYFEAETDFWKITRNVLEQRQKPEFDHSFELVEKSLRMVAQAQTSEEQSQVEQRLRGLVQFYSVLDAMVAALLRLDPANLPALAALMAGQTVEVPKKG